VARKVEIAQNLRVGLAIWELGQGLEYWLELL
jgi:hypothetical protein